MSDKGAQGERKDTSGPALKEMLEAAGFHVSLYRIVPDDLAAIEECLIDWCDREGLDLVVTTGGTGFAKTDVTPEATASVIEKHAPGISQAIIAGGLHKTPRAMLSRLTSGIRGNTLIINVPGSEMGARESLEAVLPALHHGLDILTGGQGDHGP